MLKISTVDFQSHLIFRNNLYDYDPTVLQNLVLFRDSHVLSLNEGLNKQNFPFWQPENLKHSSRCETKIWVNFNDQSIKQIMKVVAA